MITIPLEVARAGAELAQNLIRLDNIAAHARNRCTDVQYTRSGARRTGPKVRLDMMEAEEQANKATAAWREYSLIVDEWERQTTIPVVEAWQAYHRRPWPYYRVGTPDPPRYCVVTDTKPSE